ncbi:MAG: glycosyltransferase, partial [Pseudomonadota bacterium]
MSGLVPELSISIVSHRQGDLVARLLHDIATHCNGIPFEVILTLNLSEQLPFDPASFPFPVKTVWNESRKGFGQNHNAAFRQAQGRYFCVLNPDVRLQADPFPRLLAEFRDAGIGVVAPRIVDERGNPEDNARNLPAP